MPGFYSVALPDLHHYRFAGWPDAGWVARRRPLAGPLSPRGSQPVHRTLRCGFVSPNGLAELAERVLGLQYKSLPGRVNVERAQKSSGFRVVWGKASRVSTRRMSRW